MKKANLKIFIIAGEVSGDVLGAKIMNALQVGRVCPGGVGLSQTDLSKATLGQGRPTTVEFAGIGGANMRAMGLKSLFPISDLSVMGLFEVIAHARTLTRRINETAAAIIKYKPDIVLTVDSPSFATRVVKKCRGAWKRAQVGRPGSGRRGAQGLR
ncbi:MAG: hypothetical protein FWC51_04465, partial [Proteobacteria bacterium]|nr:hypothetical protein [Pseudomonadota bacterium]